MAQRIQFAATTFGAIENAVRRHLAALPMTIDSFLEERILASAHYRIALAGEPAGFASIHDQRLITQFALDEPYRRFGQSLFAHLRRLEQVQEAFVPTGDEFFLAHALDDYRRIEKQAYFFRTAPDAPVVSPAGHTLRLAGAADIAYIEQHTGDFFAPVEAYIAKRGLFVTLRGAEPVGFGLLETSVLYDDVASIGMFTIEARRRSGVGTATIALLIAECRRRGLRPVAGCWFYNHASKRTLERAGLYAPTRLLKISY